MTDEATIDRLVAALDRLSTLVHEVANVLALHMAGHQGGMTPQRIRELVTRLDEAQAAVAETPADIEIEGQTGSLRED